MLSIPASVSATGHAAHVEFDAHQVIDDHATHIWSEEIASGRLPTDQQAEEIGRAVPAIQARAFAILRDGMVRLDHEEPDTADYLTSNLLGGTGTGTRYQAYKALRDIGAFDDIPYGNEFVDKFLKAGDRWYADDIKRSGDPVSLRKIAEAGAPEHIPHAQASPATPLPAPIM